MSQVLKKVLKKLLLILNIRYSLEEIWETFCKVFYYYL